LATITGSMTAGFPPSQAFGAVQHPGHHLDRGGVAQHAGLEGVGPDVVEHGAGLGLDDRPAGSDARR
jgi:hypothetical protein